MLTDARERKLSYKRKGGRDQKSRLQRQALILASAEDVAKRNRDKEGQQGLLTLHHFNQCRAVVHNYMLHQCSFMFLNLKHVVVIQVVNY